MRRTSINTQGSTLLEMLVVSGALLATGLTALVLYRQSTSASRERIAKLALFQMVDAVEKRSQASCYESFFRSPGDVDIALPEVGRTKPRIGVEGLKVGQKFSLSTGTLEIASLELTHERLFGRDISMGALHVIAKTSSHTTFLRDRIPLFFRTRMNNKITEVVDCVVAAKDQQIESLVYFGYAGVLNDVTNPTELYNFISCVALVGALPVCGLGNAAWGINPTTGIPIVPVISPTAGGVFSIPSGPGRTISEVPQNPPMSEPDATQSQGEPETEDPEDL